MFIYLNLACENARFYNVHCIPNSLIHHIHYLSIVIIHYRILAQCTSHRTTAIQICSNYIIINFIKMNCINHHQ